MLHAESKYEGHIIKNQYSLLDIGTLLRLWGLF